METFSFVVLFGRDGADQPGDGAFVGKDFDDVGPALDFTVEAFEGVAGVEFGALLLREVHRGRDVVLGGIHEGGELGHPGPELVGNLAPLGGRALGILPGESGDDAPTLLAGMGQKVTHELYAASSPGGAEDPGHGGHETLVIVGQKPGARLVNVGDPWLLVRAEAGLDGVRIHDLRHSRIETTACYAHLERDTEKASAAIRAVAVHSRMYRMAASWGMVPDGTNPCRGVRMLPTRPRERFLTDNEFRRLGAVLDRAEADGGVSVHAVPAIRLLLLTGCRKREILSLGWEDVDLAAGELRLADSKTGPRAVPLSPPAARVLGESLPVIAKLLDHSQIRTPATVMC